MYLVAFCALIYPDSTIQFTANQVFKIEDTENSLLNIVSKIEPFPRPLPLWFCFQTKFQSLATGVVSRGGFVSTHESGSGVGDVVVDLSDSSHAKDPDNDDVSLTRRQQMTYTKFKVVTATMCSYCSREQDSFW